MKFCFFIPPEASHPDICYTLLSNICPLPLFTSKMLTSYFNSRTQSVSASQKKTSKASHKTWPQEEAKFKFSKPLKSIIFQSQKSGVTL